MLDKTQKEHHVFLSLKKLFVDELWSIHNIPVEFGFVDERPQGHDQFIVVLINEFIPSTVSSVTATIFMFSKHDGEQGQLSQLYDTVLSLFLSADEEHGFKRIPFYDADFIEFAKLIPYPNPCSAREKSYDGFYFRYFDVVFRWGGK